MNRRQLALAGLWAAATVVAVLVVWTGVRVVADDVTEPLPLATGAAPVATDEPAPPAGTSPTTVPGAGPSATTSPTTAAPATATTTAPPAVPSTSTTTARPPTTPGTAPPPAASESWTRTATGRGGTVTVRFTATTVELVVATPASGYTVEVDDAGPDRVRVSFDGGEQETRIEARPGEDAPTVAEDD